MKSQNKKMIRAHNEEIKCKDCKKDKPVSEFFFGGTSKLYGKICKECYKKTIQNLQFAIAEHDYENQPPPYFEESG